MPTPLWYLQKNTSGVVPIRTETVMIWPGVTSLSMPSDGIETLGKVGDAFDTLQAVPATSSNAASSHQERQIAIGAFSAIDARIDQILGTPIPRQAGAASMVLTALVLVLLASGPLLCLLLPFPTPLIWAGGVLATAAPAGTSFSAPCIIARPRLVSLVLRALAGARLCGISDINAAIYA